MPSPYKPAPPPKPDPRWPKNARLRFKDVGYLREHVTPAMLRAAKKIGVVIQPSTVKGKKLDAFDPVTGKKIASFGALTYGDYHIWQELEAAGLVPQGFAEMKRYLYRTRHYKNAAKSWRSLSPAYLAYEILW